MKHDLQQIQKNYFEAGVDNAKIGNELINSIQNQTFTSSGLYLIFIATLFIFLEPRLGYSLLGLQIKVWVSIAIVSASLSLLVGIIALKATHNHIVRGRKSFLTKAQKISDYMNKKKVLATDEIPDELAGVIKADDIHSTASMIANIAVISQILLFVVSLIIVVSVVIRLMF
jgi:hypothetical protein